MLSRILALSFFIFYFSSSILAQRYGNEWVKYDQNYLKIPISENGFYRISLSEIQQSGLAIENSQNIQLFHRGQEVAITLTDSYIEFYGEKNDGGQDSLLYRPFSARSHPYQTLYSYKNYYFLTVAKTAGKRIGKNVSVNLNLQPEKYHLEQQLQVYATEYSFNNFPGPVPNLQQSYYEQGEGWTGGMIRRDSLAVWEVKLQNWVNENNLPKPKVEILINGRSDFYHQVSPKIANRSLPLLEWEGYKTRKIETELSSSEISSEAKFSFSLQSIRKEDFEIYSLSTHKITYPQKFDMNGQNSKTFYLVTNSNNASLLRIENVPANAMVYDVTDRYGFVNLYSKREGNNLIVEVPNTTEPRKVFVTSEPIKTSALVGVKFEKIDPSFFNYLIVTHNSLQAGANEFATYRASTSGGNYKVKVIDIQQLYDQFSFGEHHPMAIRRYSDFMLSAGQKPYLFLIGRPYTFPDFLKDAPDDLVPSIGYPGSDILLTAGLNGEAIDTPALPTGRLNVTQNEPILTYLKKVKEFESQSVSSLWRKNVLHLNGGKSVNEIESLRDLLRRLSPLVNAQWVGGRVAALVKATTAEVENVNISKQVNDGLSLITFFGHASPTVTDLNIGFASTAGNGLNNQGKYPMMYFNGCAVGNVFFRYNTITTDWLLAPNKGAIVVMAHSYWSFYSSTNIHLQALYQTLFNNKNSLGWGVGRVHQELNRTLKDQSNDPYLVSNLHQSVLQGDPAIVIYPMQKPDYEITKPNIFIQSKNLTTSLNKADSLQVGVFVTNSGLYDPSQKVSLKVKLTYQSQQSEKHLSINSVAYSDTVLVSFKNEQGLQKVEVTADPTQTIDELSETNNVAVLDVDWSKAAQTVSYPISTQPDKLSPVLDVTFDNWRIANNDFVSNKPEIVFSLTDENRLNTLDTSTIEVFLKKCETCKLVRVANKNFTIVQSNQNLLQLKYIPTLAAGLYQLLVTGRDMAQNAVVPYQIVFQVSSENNISYRVFPNPAQYYTKFEIDILASAKPETIKLKIVDLLGRIVLEQSQAARIGQNTIIWQPSDLLSNGKYVYQTELTWADGKTEKKSGTLVVSR